MGETPMSTQHEGPKAAGESARDLGPSFLVGMMGSGKSTVGMALARALAVPFIDLDERIERMSGEAIPQLFERGEPHFRGWERAALLTLLREPGFAQRGSVVATGGGVVCDPANTDAMRSAGVTVFLDPPVDTLMARLRSPAQLAARPLLAGEEPALLRARLQRLLSDRRAEYERADFKDAADGAPHEVVARILTLLRANGGG